MKLRLRYVREYYALTQRDVAKKLGIVYSAYCMFENENKNIPTKRLIELANLYNVNVDYLLKLSDTMLKVSSKSLNLKITAARIHELREDTKMSLRDFASANSIPFTTFACYEKGKTLIQVPTLIKLCQNNGISADYILGRSNIKYLKDIK